MKGFYMTTAEYITKVILDVLFYEWIWYVLKRNPRKLTILQNVMRYLIALNIMFLILGSGIGTFINLYFMTLWYFVIYPERICNELMVEKQGPVA